jgi:hypothetical protein
MDCASAHELLSQRDGALVRHADLEAILAGVTGARHEARDAGQFGHGKVAENELAQVQLGQPLKRDAAPRELRREACACACEELRCRAPQRVKMRGTAAHLQSGGRLRALQREQRALIVDMDVHVATLGLQPASHSQKV